MPGEISNRDLAGSIGCEMAEKITASVIEAVEGFPASSDTQQPAILRVMAATLTEHADGMEA